MGKQLPPFKDLGREDLMRLVEEILLPDRVTPALVSRALNRAFRLRIYWLLDPLEKAILRAASRARISEYKSPKVRELLAKLIARIEAQTPRGLALAAGLFHAFSRGLLESCSHVSFPRSIMRDKISYLLYLGKNLLETKNYYVTIQTFP